MTEKAVQNGITVRGADGSLYFVATNGAERIEDAAMSSSPTAIHPNEAAVASATKQVPLLACIMISDEGVERPVETTAAAELPMMACFMISDDGADRPIEVAGSTQFPMMACFINIDESGANEREPVAA